MIRNLRKVTQRNLGKLGDAELGWISNSVLARVLAFDIQ
jgi:hypothetical protein